MPNTPADTLIPLAVVAICAVGLVLSAHLGPDKASPKANASRAVKVTPSESKPATGQNAQTASTLPKVSWQQQPDTEIPFTRIGFGSCQKQNKPIPIWSRVVSANPQTFVMLGDNVYGDFKEPTADTLIGAYAQLATHSDFQKAAAAIPMLAIWDDHDYGTNDGGADFVHKTIATDVFRQFWAGSGTLKGERGPGVAYAHTFGPPGKRTQIIMLDTRSFRSPLVRVPGKRAYQPDADPTKTMLGDAQWQWLEDQLGKPADLRLVASSIQVLADGHTWERWGNLPTERERLLALTDKADGRVIFLSGDRHRAGIYRMARHGNPNAIEVTSSSLNHSFPDRNEQGPHQIGAMFGGNNFGIIDVDWTARHMAVSIRDETGTTVRAMAVPLDIPPG